MVGWVARKAGLGRVRATIAMLRLSALCAIPERRTTLRMQRIFRKMDDAPLPDQRRPQQLLYWNKAPIENLFECMGIPIKQFSAFVSCWVIRI
jgi:hypothetical protein